MIIKVCLNVSALHNAKHCGQVYPDILSGVILGDRHEWVRVIKTWFVFLESPFLTASQILGYN